MTRSEQVDIDALPRGRPNETALPVGIPDIGLRTFGRSPKEDSAEVCLVQQAIARTGI
jgi:hypothetical protein